MIRDMRFDVCIFSMDGCKGLTGPGTNEVTSHVFSKMVFQNSNYRIIISDQSKLDLPANYQVYEFNDYDLVITDTLTDEHRRVFIEENGMNPDRLLEVAVL
jgi:DeoR/GlpR family transcriptional regulator of sugar metabolism